MGPTAQTAIVILFVAAFGAMWLGVASMVAAMSGWPELSRRFPDQQEPAVLTLRGQSGTLRGVNFRRMLTLAACPSGLRLGVSRIFAPFQKPILVPWSEITIERKPNIVWPTAEIHLGQPQASPLKIFGRAADRLARASGGRWPEPGPFPPETLRQTFFNLAPGWALSGALIVGVVFLNWFVSDGDPWPTLAVVFCAVVAAFSIRLFAARLGVRLRRY